jgi:hypothetical protein
MDKHTLDRLPEFLDVLGLDEVPMDMLHRFDTSFLKTKTWSTVQKKIARSQKVWGERG